MQEVTYLLTGIPKPLWTQAKVKCVQEGVSLKSMLLDAIREYVEPGNQLFPASPPPVCPATGKTELGRPPSLRKKRT